MKRLSQRELQPRVYEALRQWNSSSADSALFESLYVFQRKAAETKESAGEVCKQVVLQALHMLEEHHEEDASLLMRSFIQNELDSRIARDLNIAESTLYRRKNSALARLTEALFKLEERVRRENHARLLSRLEPPTYVQLVGVESHLSELEEIFASGQAPWTVSLEGIGGIGKTSLADALVRRLIESNRVNELAWVTARPNIFQQDGRIHDMAAPVRTVDQIAEILFAQLIGYRPAPELSSGEILSRLRAALKDGPHLIVIDNLETLPDVERQIGVWQDMANPSRFLLTSRRSVSSQSSIYHYPVPELSREATLALIRQEARLRNVRYMDEANDEDLSPIVDAVGGNPLAVRLVVGQIHLHPLETVLDNLVRAGDRNTERLYRYIYWWAWEQLDEGARRVLLAMPLVPVAGATAEHLSRISGLDRRDLYDALDVLVRLNLVDARGSLHERSYTIHSLTRTFLHEQVLSWPSK